MQHLLNVTGIMTPIISLCRNTLKSGGAVGAPLFSPNALKRPLNWPKFTHKFLEARPNVPGYPPFFRSWICHCIVGPTHYFLLFSVTIYSPY